MRLSDLYDADYRTTHPQAEIAATTITAKSAEQIRAARTRRIFARVIAASYPNQWSR